MGDIHGPVHLQDGASLDQCLRDLRITDPREDKDRIGSKDRLLRDCCAWVLESPNFRRWRDRDDTKLLWIKGDPGKGKTMIMIALVKELSERFKAKPGSSILSPMLAKLKDKTRSGILSYFFCQSTDSRLNNSISVLKGLIYLLVIQKKGLIRHVRKRYDEVQDRIFEGPNALYALRATLLDILNDSTLPRTYLLVDALDECVVELRLLLDIITGNNFETRSKVKWLVASRHRPDIEERLRPNGLRIKISLELNATHVSRAVNTFINYKVRELAARKKYDTKLQKEVKNQLRKKAEATFLWVALACKRLSDEEVPLWETRSVLRDLPSGLEPLYGLMMNQILRRGDVELCKQILRTVTVTFRPLLLRELAATAGLPEALFDSTSSLHDLVDRCGSFLTVREGAIHFIHQSAKDYLATGNGRRIFPSSKAEEHGNIMHRSLDLMANTLRKDMCNLKKPGALAREAEQNISNGLLPRIGYACCYWVNHLGDYLVDSDSAQRYQILHDGRKVHEFLQNHLLHWIEVLSLLRTMPEGVLMIKHLESVFDDVSLLLLVRQQELTDRI